MTSRRPPRLATWLLDRLGYARQNAALAGDLLEEFRAGRSRAWYWRQTFMVISNGVGRNAFVLRKYLKAVLVGWAAQLLVALTLWRFHAPPALQVAAGVKVALYVLLQAAGVAFYLLIRRLTGRPEWDLQRMFCACASHPQEQPAIVALVAMQTFGNWLLSYCLCQLILIRFTLEALVGYEMLWLVLWELTPALVPVPVSGQLPAAETPAISDQPTAPAAYPPQDLALPVALSDGRTVLLRAETIVEAAFMAADEKLISVLFRRGASLELLRRAIWLGSFRYYGEPRDPVSLVELAQLVNQAARTPRVEQAFFYKPPESRWQRLRRRIRLHAA